MAIVTGPLHSDDARGKLASSLVFLGWKGIKTVRQWVKPTNPQSADQGNVRCIIGGLGKVIGKIVASSAFHDQLTDLDLIPDQQSKQSYLVQYVKDNYLTGSGATMTGNFVTENAAFTAHTAYTTFQAAGATLNITDFGMSYDSIIDFDKGFGLYLLAQAAIALGFTGAPYTKTLASWTATQIDLMIADMTGAGV